MELKDAHNGYPILPISPDPQDARSLAGVLKAATDLIGKRVQIRAVKAHGSARLLDGLTGTVTAVHPIASGWVKLDLDENSRTPHRDWSVAADRLVLIASELPPQS